MEQGVFQTNPWPKKTNCHGHLDERCANTTSAAFRQGKRAPFADQPKDLNYSSISSVN